MLWNYVRSKAREAFLAGIADGIQELEGQAPEDLGTAVALLRARLAPALPAPAENGNGQEEPAGRRRKAAT